MGREIDIYVFIWSSEFEFHIQIFEENNQMANFTKIPPMRADLYHARRTDRPVWRNYETNSRLTNLGAWPTYWKDFFFSLFLVDSDLRRVSFVSLNAINACSKTPYSLTLYPLMERLYYCLLLKFVSEAGSFVTLFCRSNWSPFFIRAWGTTVERKDPTFRA